MNKLKSSYPVIITGGGPVGLLLAVILQQKGIECLVLEKRSRRTTHSRSIGIHPVSLELMQKVGLAEEFLKQGIEIREGIAFGDRVELGRLSFESCPGPYRFILALPQFITEKLLEQHLEDLNANVLRKGAEVIEINEKKDKIYLTLQMNGSRHKLECDFLAGCDGKESVVRKSAGFAFEGGPYRDNYMMGDFSDNTSFGSRAVIFLSSEGLTESFPLLGNRRRWVVKTEPFIEREDRNHLEARIQKRTGHDISKEKNYMLSSFGVQKYIARPMARRRIFLAGDAAHIISPIGGQGMNLGWMDAVALAQVLEEACSGHSNDVSLLAKRYSANRIKTAKKAIRRAEFNMILGRKTQFPFFRNMVVRLMLKTPLQRLMAQLFTMRGLDRWPL